MIAYTYEQVMERGIKERSESTPWPEATSPDHPYTLMYTSGTTGDPKGAMVTNQNILSMLACSFNCPSPPHMRDRVLSYLPLAHVFGQVSIWID